MENFKTGYYTASTIDGVLYYGDFLTDEDIDVLPAKDFYKGLDYVEDGEILFTFIDESEKDLFETIKSEYGIQG